MGFLFSDKVLEKEGINLFIGDKPPKNCILLGKYPSSIGFFLDYAFSSEYFSEGLKLKNIRVYLGRRTLISDAIFFSLNFFGAKGIEL